MRSQPYHDDTDDDAFDSSGVLKDGRSYKVPMRFADGVLGSSRNHLARIHDGNGNSGVALQRPGFRVADQYARDEVEVAYQQYEAAIQNEWRNVRFADFGSPGVGSKENAYNHQKPESYLSDLDADVNGRVKTPDRQRDVTCECGRRRQSGDVATLIRDHQERMQPPESTARELSQPAAMATATTAQAKLAGLWIERSEQMRKQPDEMSDGEIAAILRANAN
jgi:hypothetical protein